MASTLERGRKEGIHDACGCVLVDESGRQHKDVGIVVLAAERGNLRPPADSRTHTLMLVEGDAYAFTRSAQCDGQRASARLHGIAQGMGKVGIVAAVGGEGAEVSVGHAMKFQIMFYMLLHLESCMVAG